MQLKGHDVKSILDTDPAMNNFSILKLALSDKRIVITMDKDFGELVFTSGLKHEGILLLRLEDMNGQEKSEMMDYIMENFADKLQNNFCVFKKDRFRIRKR